MALNRTCRTLTSYHRISLAIFLAVAPSLVVTSALAEERPTSRENARADDLSEGEKQSVVAYWKFQKGIAGDAASRSQLLEDASGNGRHARAVGGPLYHAVDLPTTTLALAFDGHDDRISVADHKAFYLTKSFTIEAWIEIAFYPGSRQNRSFVIFRGDDRAGFDPWFLGLEESGQLTFLMADSLNNASIVRSPQPLPTRQFLHLAAVFDDEKGVQSLFIDGQKVATTRTKIRAGGALGGTRPGIGIGGRQDHSHQGFRGSIAELRITAKALTKSEFLRGHSR